jgi:hypothetical protein
MCRPGRRGLAPGVFSPKRYPRYPQGSRECPWIPWAMRGQTVDPPVIFREPDGLFTEDGGRRNPGASGPVNRPLPLPVPSNSAQMRHQAGSMIADAVRYMSVHSWKQPDFHGHSGTAQPQKQQPARPGIPSSRAVSAGSGRCWSNQRRLSRRFTVSPSQPIGMPTDLRILRSTPRGNRVLSVWRP